MIKEAKQFLLQRPGRGGSPIIGILWRMGPIAGYKFKQRQQEVGTASGGEMGFYWEGINCRKSNFVPQQPCKFIFIHNHPSSEPLFWTQGWEALSQMPWGEHGVTFWSSGHQFIATPHWEKGPFPLTLHKLEFLIRPIRSSLDSSRRWTQRERAHFTQSINPTCILSTRFVTCFSVAPATTAQAMKCREWWEHLQVVTTVPISPQLCLSAAEKPWHPVHKTYF